MSNPTGSRSERKEKPAAGGQDVLMIAALVCVLGLGSSYLLWGNAGVEAQHAGSTASQRSTNPERVVGTRDNPLPVGAEATVGVWNVAIGTPKKATKTLADENQFGDPPREGFGFYFVPITATYQGEDSKLAWGDLDIKFVGDDARTYSGECSRHHDPMREVDELYRGGVAEGLQCVEAPMDVGGLWVLSTPPLRTGDRVFFRAD